MAKKEIIKEEKEDIKNTDSLSSILKEHKEEHYNFQERKNWKVSTGSLLLDMAMGGGVNPSLVRICGANNEGKTPETLEILRNFLTENPKKRKGFWVIAEGRGLSKENVERCGLTFVYKAEEWVAGTIFVLESNVFELFIKCVKDLVLNNPDEFEYAFVVDSIDGLQLRSDKEKEVTENNKVAGVPSLSKKMLQSLSLGMFKYGHMMILISQVTAEIKIDQYSKSPNRGGEFSGGNSLLHGSDWILEWERTYNGDYIMDNPNGKLNDGKSKPIGKWCKVVLQKSAVEASRKTKIIYPIKFGKKPSGIWLEYEVCDILLAHDLIKKGGAGWLSLSDYIKEELATSKIEFPEKIQGMDNLRKHLEENPDTTKFFVEKIKSILSS